MEVIKIILMWVGAATLIMSTAGILLFLIFYKRAVMDYVDREMEQEQPLTIDDLIN